jgi:hypothetical protein
MEQCDEKKHRINLRSLKENVLQINWQIKEKHEKPQKNKGISILGLVLSSRVSLIRCLKLA